MKRTGIFGGAFNPVHHGHLISAMHFIESCQLDELILIPAYRSPFKQEDSMALHRLQMCRLAVKDIKGMSVSDWEIEQGSTSFTVDTLRHFSEPGRALYMLIGYDQIPRFHEWKEYETIFTLATVVVARRGGIAELTNPVIDKERFHFIRTPHIEISSTDIRNRSEKNQRINFLVPPEVADYITYHNLYRFGIQND